MQTIGGANSEKKYLEQREPSHEEFINMRCDMLRKMRYSESVIAKFRKSGALKWPKLMFVVEPSTYTGVIIDRMPDF